MLPISLKGRFISHFTYSILALFSTLSIISQTPSTTSLREKSKTYWFLALAGVLSETRITQSGCFSYNTESGEIISGSNQIPNFIPKRFTPSTRYFKPPGNFFSFTIQSPKALLSSKRFPNQPSSITSISIPKLAAFPAISNNFSVLKSK